MINYDFKKILQKQTRAYFQAGNQIWISQENL